MPVRFNLRSLHGALVPLLLVLLQAACASGAGQMGRQEVEMATARESSARHWLVETRYSRSGKALALEVVRARKVKGALPFLRDSPDLGGQVELLDSRGRVLWSMGYEPGPVGAGSPSPSEPASGPILRLPALAGAHSVRLAEPARQISVTVELSSSAS